MEPDPAVSPGSLTSADVILATAPNSKAITELAGDLSKRGK
jgi:hypothetical protein